MRCLKCERPINRAKVGMVVVKELSGKIKYYLCSSCASKRPRFRDGVVSKQIRIQYGKQREVDNELVATIG